MAYDDTMKRSVALTSHEVEYARAILAWLLYTRRRLNTNELQEALAIKTGATKLEVSDFLGENEILKVCAGLVVTEKPNGELQLVHSTAEKYLLQQHRRWLGNVEALLALTFLIYLSLRPFTLNDIHPSSTEPTATLRSTTPPITAPNARSHPPFALLAYAAMKWADHVREAQDRVHDQAVRFLRNPTTL
jgi:hypothetical protein